MKKIALGLVASLLSTTAYAQTADTIVVTARKTEEKILTTPVSVRYYGGEDLKNDNTYKLNEVVGFGEKSVAVNSEAFLLTLRGQSQNDVSVTVDQIGRAHV